MRRESGGHCWSQGLAGVVGGLWLLAAGAGCGTAVSQPIQFNHKLHLEKVGLDCAECHQYFKTEKFSGIPGKEKCLECHDTAVTKSPEEEKIRQYAKQNEEIPWQQIYHVPDHVRYSHRRHVALGGLECKTCHGPIAETTSPPGAPLNKITMDFCINCHRQKGQSVDCIACHK